MRITFVIPVLDVSGGARIIAGHAQRLAAKGHEVAIVAPPLRRGIKETAKALIGLGPRPVRPDQSHYGLARIPVRVTARAGPIGPDEIPDADVIIATWWETVEWVWALPSSKGAKVHFIQGYDAFSDVIADRVDAVWRLPLFKIAVAQWLTDLGKQRFGIERMALVPNSVDHHLFNAKPRMKAEIPTVGFLFHGMGLKDIPTSIEALRLLRDREPATKILAFGASQPARGQLPLGTEYHRLPPQQRIAEVYGRCDAWLSTSRREGFNLPPLEAMATGTPAVCARTGRPAEIIENGVNGYLVDAGDVAAFADGLASILSLPNRDWKRMSQAASRAVAHPTWAESSAQFEEALDQAIASPAHG